MSDLILHHYPISPFSEKVRLVFGLKGLAWKSVIIPSIMPKPDVVALTGGFRKTPFLQIGSDIYCDSALICEVLDAIEPQHHLYPDSSKGLARIIAQWADSTLFWAAMAHNLSPKGAAAMFANAPPRGCQSIRRRPRSDVNRNESLTPSGCGCNLQIIFAPLGFDVRAAAFFIGPSAVYC